MRPHAILGPVINRTDFEVDAFQGTESTFDMTQLFIETHRIFIAGLGHSDIGADDIDAMQGGQSKVNRSS